MNREVLRRGERERDSVYVAVDSVERERTATSVHQAVHDVEVAELRWDVVDMPGDILAASYIGTDRWPWHRAPPARF